MTQVSISTDYLLSRAGYRRRGRDGSLRLLRRFEERARGRFLRYMETGALEGQRRRRIRSQQLPDQAAAIVLDGDQRHAQIDTDHVRVVPVAIHVESVGEPVAPPDLRPVSLIHRLPGLDRQIRREHDRRKSARR